MRSSKTPTGNTYRKNLQVRQMRLQLIYSNNADSAKRSKRKEGALLKCDHCARTTPASARLMLRDHVAAVHEENTKQIPLQERLLQCLIQQTEINVEAFEIEHVQKVINKLKAFAKIKFGKGDIGTAGLFWAAMSESCCILILLTPRCRTSRSVFAQPCRSLSLSVPYFQAEHNSQPA